MTRSGRSGSLVDAAVLASSISIWWLPFSNGYGTGAEIEDHVGVACAVEELGALWVAAGDRPGVDRVVPGFLQFRAAEQAGQGRGVEQGYLVESNPRDQP